MLQHCSLPLGINNNLSICLGEVTRQCAYVCVYVCTVCIHVCIYVRSVFVVYVLWGFAYGLTFFFEGTKIFKTVAVLVAVTVNVL